MKFRNTVYIKLCAVAIAAAAIAAAVGAHNLRRGY
jgi:hypothetical protein